MCVCLRQINRIALAKRQAITCPISADRILANEFCCSFIILAALGFAVFCFRDIAYYPCFPLIVGLLHALEREEAAVEN